MFRPIGGLLTALVITSVLSGADSEPKKGEPEPKHDATVTREAEVKLADGSTVRVLLLQESIDVVTKYGKLKVPTSDIRRIDFGIHTPDDVVKKIEDALARLASDTFNQREAAGKVLVEFGATAYPQVRTAAKSADPEVAQRAQVVLERIKDKVPASQLRTKVEDVIVTTEFTVQGRIASPAVKVRTAYFGDLDLKVNDLRAFRSTVGNTGEAVEFVVDASKCSNQDNTLWQDTGLNVEPDAPLSVTASGQVSLRDGVGAQFNAGPAGNQQFRRNAGGPYAPGTLLGKIGENGSIFVIGEKYETTPKQEGKLLVQIAPSPWQEVCSGTYKLKVTGAHKEGAP
jgi:hypothetical protein